MSTLEKIGVTFFLAFIGSMLLFALWAITHLPGAFTAEEKCLSRGFPNSHYTWNYKTYCSSLDGAVTVNVEEIK